MNRYTELMMGFQRYGSLLAKETEYQAQNHHAMKPKYLKGKPDGTGLPQLSKRDRTRSDSV